VGIVFFWIALLLIFGFVIRIIFSLLSNPEAQEYKYKYKRRNFLITRAEHELYDVLVAAFGEKYYIFPQIHLPSLVDHKIVGQNWYGAFRHIDEKSVDFVICDKQYIKPLLAIELDDQTHETEKIRMRDIEVEAILSNAGLPLLRIKNHEHFNKDEIIQNLTNSLTS
jgi:very-short-patch-repair endonuclease